LFETLRIIRGHIPFIKAHYERLVSGLKLLHITIPNHFTLSFFHGEILKLCGHRKIARVRFTAFRQEGGLYAPTDNRLQFLITALPLQPSKYEWADSGLVLQLYPDIPLAYSRLSPLKTINALPYVLAAAYKHTVQADDVFLLNQQGRIAEASSSNVFLWTGKKLLTPSLEEACVAGIIRRILLENAAYTGLQIEEGQLTISDLKKAKAIFLTNSIQGLKWVSSFEQKRYESSAAMKVGEVLLDLLNRRGG
jgi:branched-chain amino acid aminotransferase